MVKKQANLDSFFGIKKKATPAAAASAKKTKKKKSSEPQKENASNADDDDDKKTVETTATTTTTSIRSKKKVGVTNSRSSQPVNDEAASSSSSPNKRKTTSTKTVEEDDNESAAAAPSSSNKSKRRRRVIQDDSSSEEEEYNEPPPSKDDDETMQVDSDEEEEEEKPAAKRTKKPPSAAASSKAKKNKSEEDEEEEYEPQSSNEDDETMEVDEEQEEEEKKPATKRTKKAPPPAATASTSKKKKKSEEEDASSSSSSTPACSKKSKAATEASSSDSNKKKKSTTKKQASSSTTTKGAVAAAGHKSNQALLEELAKANNNSDWKAGEPMPYLELCRTFRQIEDITGRLQIQELLTTLLRKVLLQQQQQEQDTKNANKKQVEDDTIYAVVYLASNSVAPACQNVELGIGDSLLIKAIGQATGTNTNMVKSKYESVGDLGSVAQSFKGKQKTLGGFFTSKKKTTGLTASEILKAFREIAQTKGNQSQKWKVEQIKGLLVRCSDPTETRYIIRGLQGKLRIGLASSTVLISLAHALALTTAENSNKKSKSSPPAKTKAKDDASNTSDIDEENEYPPEAQQFMDPSQPADKRLEAAVAIVKKAYMEVPSYDALLDAALTVPLEQLHKACTLSPGIPVSPMLAKPTKSIQEVLQRLNGLRFTCEYKYDGERAQIHLLPDGKTKVFSRNLLDTTEKYPEAPGFVQEAVRHQKNDDDSNAPAVTSYVMDAEVVAFNNKTGQLVPFQVLSTRKKTEESAETAKVQVILQAFDLMYLNGQSLLSKTLAERRALLHQHFQQVPGKFQFAVSLDHEENGDTTVIEEFLDQAVKGQCEGLMVKTLDTANSIYEPSRRSLNWLKLKKDYLQGLGDSVDLCVLGAYHGRGKRTGVYGAYLLACFDPDTEEFQSVCKIGTGFSEEDLKQLTTSLNEHVISSKSSQYNVSEQLACDVWFDAVQVWEVKAADLSQSSAHRGAMGKTGSAGRGIGLRFPRFERVRTDKPPEQATTSDQILEMYYNQDSIVAAGGGGSGSAKGGGGDDDDDNDEEDGI